MQALCAASRMYSGSTVHGTPCGQKTCYTTTNDQIKQYKSGGRVHHRLIALSIRLLVLPLSVRPLLQLYLLVPTNRRKRLALRANVNALAALSALHSPVPKHLREHDDREPAREGRDLKQETYERDEWGNEERSEVFWVVEVLLLCYDIDRLRWIGR